MRAEATPFDEFIQHVREVFFALRAISEDLLEGLDCTAPERSILADLDRLGPQTVPAMAQARFVSRQAMQKNIDRLIEQKRVQAEPNPRHRRSVLIALTPVGQKLFSEIRTRERRLLSRRELPVSEAELRRTARTLREVAIFLTADGLAGARAARGDRS